MKTLSAGMTAHLATETHSRARMLRLDLADGTIIAATSHDRDLEFDLGDGEGPILYRADLGVTLSDVELSCGLQAGNYEFRGPIGDTFTRGGVLGGRFDDAAAWLFQVNWKALGDGPIRLLRGFATNLLVEGGEFVGEIQDLRARLNQTVGRVITPQCWKDFGSVECGAAVTAIAGTVTAVTDAMRFSVSFAGAYADNLFNKGKVVGLAGGNIGIVRKIERWAASGAIELFDPLIEAPQVGDTFTVKNGCSKLRLSANASIPTCLTHANVTRFGGYPDGPGTQQIQRVAIPGEGNQ